MDEKPIIDVDLQINEADALEDVDRFVRDLTAKLQMVKQMLDNAKIDDESRQNLEARRQALEGVIQSVGELVTKTTEAERRAKDLNQEVSKLGRVVKGASLKGYGFITRGMFNDAKESAREAREEFLKLNSSLTQTAPDIAKVKTELNNITRSIGLLEIARRREGKSDATEFLIDNLKEQGKYTDKAIDKVKEHRKALEDTYGKNSPQLRAYNVLQAINAEEAKEKKRVEELKAQEEERLRILEEQRKAISNRISALTREKAELKQSAAQWYYVLRALKMAKFSLDNFNKSVDNFLKKSVSGVDKTTKRWWKFATLFLTLSKYIGKAATAFTDLKRKSESAKKSHDGLVDSFKKGFLTILKYAFGIRSLYFLFRKLRSAMATGIENLATQYSHVNDQMSSVVSSLERMKNAIATMIQPLLNLLVPALEKLSESFANAAYSIGSFFAALTGQDFVYYAKKIRKQYIEDEKAKKKDKKATKDLNDETDRQLSNLDKLNVLTSPKNKTEDEEEETNPITDMFDIVPIKNKFKDLLKKIKEFLKPIMDAWAKMRDFVIGAWKYAFDEIKKLFKSIWRDFLRVWFEDAESFFTKIFKIAGDVGLIIGNIAKALREAWDFEIDGETNGYRILKAISSILNIIVDGIMRAADYTVEWSKDLSFIPLFTTIADVLQKQVVPAVQKVVDLAVVLYKDVFLELLRFVIEELGPVFIRIFGNIAETIGNFAERFREAWEEGNRGKKIIATLESIIRMISDVILRVTEETKEWAKSIDFGPALDAIHDILQSLKQPIHFIVETFAKFWTNVLLPFWKNLIEKGLPKLRDTIEKIVNNINWDRLSSAVDKLFEVISTFLEKYGDFMLALIENLADKITELVNSGKLEEWITNIGNLLDKVDPEKVADLAIFLGKTLIQLRLITGPLSKILGMLTTGISIANVFKQMAVLKATKSITSEINALRGALDGTAAAASGAANTAGAAATTLGNTTTAVAGVAGAAESAAAGSAAATSAAAGAAATAGKATIASLEMSVAEMEVAKASYTTMGDAALAAGGAAAAGAAIATVGAVTVTKKLQEMDDAAKGGNGKISELGTGLHSLGDILLQTGEITEEQSKKLFDSVEQWETHGLTAEEITEKLAFELNQMGVSSTAASSALSQAHMQNEITDSSYLVLKDAVAGLSDETVKLETSVQGELISYDDLNERLETAANNIGLDADRYIMLRDAMQETYDQTGSLDSAYQAIIDTAEQCCVSTDELIQVMGVDLPNGAKAASDIVVEEMTAMPTDMANGFKQGMDNEFGTDGEKVYDKTSGSFSGFLQKIKQFFGINSPSTVFADMGKNLILGLVNGLLDNSVVSSVVNAMKSISDKVIKTANTLLKSTTLVNTGKNLITGLANGLLQSMNKALNAIRNVANQIINTAKSAFKTHSPSKVFEEIGEFITEGLAIGVEEDTDDVTDAFEELVPSSEFLDVFYDKFISTLSNLREESIFIVTAMIDEIESIVARIDNLAVLDTLSSQLANVSKIEIPDIALGYKLPENEKFSQTQTMDMSKLPSMLKAAFIEAFTETDALQSDSGDTIIQIDGNEVFRVVRKENDKYKKQTGVSALT